MSSHTMRCIALSLSSSICRLSCISFWGRVDLPLPVGKPAHDGRVGRWRVECDLRFSVEETRASSAHGLDTAVAEADMAALTARTEGWLAGLHLVALSLAGR
ncbi:MAG: hypothetical protein R2854_15045 [Caldilineaceae bacterium]